MASGWMDLDKADRSGFGSIWVAGGWKECSHEGNCDVGDYENLMIVESLEA